MTELMTVVVMLSLALMGGVITVALSYKKSPMKEKINNLILLYSSSVLQLLLLNMFRFMLLIKDEIYAYSENIFLLFCDIVLTIIGVIAMSYYVKSGLKYRGLWSTQNIFLVGTMTYFMGEFIFFYNRYHNIKSTIYEMLIVQNMVAAGFFAFVLCMIVELIYRFVKHQIQDILLAKGGIKNKIAITQPVILLYIVTLWIYPALETYLINSNEFDFSISKVWYCYFGVVLGVYVASSLIFWVLKGKVLEIVLTAVWSLSICAYIQSMFLNNKLFLMDGKEGEWTNSFQLVNVAVWFLLFFIFFRIGYSKSGKKYSISKNTSLVLCAMQLIAGISLSPNYVVSEKAVQSQNDYLSTEGLCEIAEEGNVIVFVLDTYDIDYVNEVLEENQDFLKPLKGFTYFPDTVSQFSRTFPSIIYMLTNKEYFYEYPQSDYKEIAYNECELWTNMSDSGYKYYLYEEDTDFVGKSVRTKAGNYVEQGSVIDEKISFWGCAEAIYRINSYRMFPYSIKDYFKYTSSLINDLVIPEKIWDRTKYEADDAQIYQELKKNGLHISEDDYAFRFIHLNGAHVPYTMNEKGERVKEGAHVRISQYIGSMNYVFDYLKELQDLGLYEQATIVITADHGENYVTSELGQNTNPILFIKPSGVGTDNELKISDVYASQNDVMPTIAADINVPIDKNWGLDLFNTEGKDKERTRYHYYAVVENTHQTRTKTYKVEGSSLDFNNWIPTEEYHEFGIYY